MSLFDEAQLCLEYLGSMSFTYSYECNRMLIIGSFSTYKKLYTTFSNGSLGSRIDEERSEMR